MSLYVCTTIGGTRYLDEWCDGIKKLNPDIIAIARDMSRSEPIGEPIDNSLILKNSITKVIDFDSNIKWNSYELRHLDWKSDESILRGMIILLEDFVNSGKDFFLHIDSDVILDDGSIRQMTSGYNDYCQFTLPVVPRELNSEQWADWRRYVGGFNDTTNFSISRRLAINSLENIKKLVGNAYPVDIRIHQCLKDAFKKLDDGKGGKSTLVMSKTLGHYVKGQKVNL